jgi:DNA-binding MarR family transcriptional regulator/GNAT superfamily N-acetyltransferase
MDTMDIINELAELAFATRLKRLSDRLSKDASLIYKKLDLDFKARWFPILYALNNNSPMSVTTLARSVGLTHTAVNNITSEMLKKQLLISEKGKQDERKRLLSISKKGRKVSKSLVPALNEIRLVTKELCDESKCDILFDIKKIEDQLDRKSLYERLRLRMFQDNPGEIQIKTYRPAYKKYFNLLNLEWLKKYYTIEDKDKKILDDPNRKIIKKGGTIYFANLDNYIVGTVALIKHKNGIFELAKLAVTKDAQGFGIGKMLVKEIINHANNLEIKDLYLRTGPQLKAANHIYTDLGFKKIDTTPFGDDEYLRQPLTMKLIL